MYLSCCPSLSPSLPRRHHTLHYLRFCAIAQLTSHSQCQAAGSCLAHLFLNNLFVTQVHVQDVAYSHVHQNDDVSSSSDTTPTRAPKHGVQLIEHEFRCRCRPCGASGSGVPDSSSAHPGYHRPAATARTGFLARPHQSELLADPNEGLLS